jgi:hypothetical protein
MMKMKWKEMENFQCLISIGRGGERELLLLRPVSVGFHWGFHAHLIGCHISILNETGRREKGFVSWPRNVSALFPKLRKRRETFTEALHSFHGREALPVRCVLRRHEAVRDRRDSVRASSAGQAWERPSELRRTDACSATRETTRGRRDSVRPPRAQGGAARPPRAHRRSRSQPPDPPPLLGEVLHSRRARPSAAAGRGRLATGKREERDTGGTINL